MSILDRIRGKLIPTRFESAFIRLYNDQITADQFIEECGIPDRADAWDTLCKYRRRVLSGEIRDPRDRYNRWRRR